MRIEIELDGRPFSVGVERTGSTLRLEIGDDAWDAEVERIGQKTYNITLGGASFHVEVPDADTAVVDDTLLPFKVTGFDPIGDAAGTGAGDGTVRPPMPGNIARILVGEGDHVTKGAPMVVLEAMKMQNEILAPYNAKVRKIRVGQGDTVTLQDVVLELDQQED